MGSRYSSTLPKRRVDIAKRVATDRHRSPTFMFAQRMSPPLLTRKCAYVGLPLVVLGAIHRRAINKALPQRLQLDRKTAKKVKSAWFSQISTKKTGFPVQVSIDREGVRENSRIHLQSNAERTRCSS